MRAVAAVWAARVAVAAAWVAARPEARGGGVWPHIMAMTASNLATANKFVSNGAALRWSPFRYQFLLDLRWPPFRHQFLFDQCQSRLLNQSPSRNPALPAQMATTTTTTTMGMATIITITTTTVPPLAASMKKNAATMLRIMVVAAARGGGVWRQIMAMTASNLETANKFVSNGAALRWSPFQHQFLLDLRWPPFRHQFLLDLCRSRLLDQSPSRNPFGMIR
jgi:hypothetical protein